jgi:excisionase family DNA binding protein
LSPVPESEVEEKGDETSHTVVARRREGAYVMNEFGQKGKVPLSQRLSVSPEEASALTGIGLTSIREAISSGDLKAKKHGRRTIILPDDLRVWLKTLPDARKPIEESPA